SEATCARCSWLQARSRRSWRILLPSICISISCLRHVNEGLQCRITWRSIPRHCCVSRVRGGGIALLTAPVARKGQVHRPARCSPGEVGGQQCPVLLQ